MRIFLDEKDYELFLLRVATQVERHGTRLHMYCLMPNHFHLVVETPRANLGPFMQSLQTSYAMYFNLRHKRVGHVFQGRFVSRLVQEDAYLLRLSQYVHLNPVRVASAKSLPLSERRKILRAFPWSSYRTYAGFAPRAPFVTYDPVLAQVAGAATSPEKEYRRFVEQGMAETDAEFEALMRNSPRGLGDDDFRGRVDALHQRAAEGRHDDDILLGRRETPVKPQRAIEAVAAAFKVPYDRVTQRTRGSTARPAAAWLLARYCCLTQREVARWLNLKSGAAVSIQIRNLERKMHGDPGLRRTLNSLRNTLGKHDA